MRVNEQGRSMIEMLGVLAIVGVLSVGGIAGYSKAMNKFKTNKVIDQINMISTNIRTLYSSQRTYKGLCNGIAIATGVVPAEMYEIDGSNIDASHDITNAFGGKVKISAAYYNTDPDNQNAYIIAFDGLPKASCVTAATTDWGGDIGSGFAAMYVSGDVDDIDAGISEFLPSGTITSSVNIAVPGDKSYGTPISVMTAQQACSSNASNTFVLLYI